MKDIVLLGATGYVGSALLNEALERGEKVTAIVRNLHGRRSSVSCRRIRRLRFSA
ncbi:MAG: NmrA family NAD(P)-binding protein [Muribaculaceae bacterium]|nr:NmrA family NAD(P)-binding protein [Muribaculaceae bacterium]